MKKILFVVNDLNSGGIENYLLRFLQFYNGQFYPIVWCKSGDLGVLKYEYSKIDNIILIPAKIGFVDVKGLNSFRRYLSTNCIDTVVDFGGNFAGLTMLAASLAGVRSRITFYRGATNHFKYNYLRLFYNYMVNKLVLKYSTSILSNSQAAFNFFFKKVDSRFLVIYNGIDLDRFSKTKKGLREELSIPNNAFVIGHVGRIAREKNHEAVFKVAIELCTKYKDFYFIMCGLGVEQSFSHQVQALGLSEKILLLGYRDDIPKILKTFDVFYFPSFSEGQPNALIEALIAEIPFVASNIPSILETIPKTHHEFLTSPDNIKDAIDKIESFYMSDTLKKKAALGEWARVNFDPVVLFKKFYDQL